MMRKGTIHSPWKKKLLVLLQAGLVLGLTRHHGRRRYALRSIPKEFRKVEKRYLYRCLHEFHHDRLVEYKERADGTIEMILTEQGRTRALKFNIDIITLPTPPRWDGVWRMVLSDIPETKRRGRDALRHKLKELGFVEWQKSVFVYPHPCRDQIDFVVEFFDLRRYVRYVEFTKPTNEAELKLKFDL